ncbi:hypothetical protein ABTE09_19225, partial [Acinetobacter baumannii]
MPNYQEPQNPAFAFLKAIAKKPKGDFCHVCRRTHEKPGAFLCLQCGMTVCILGSLGQCGEMVMSHHAGCDWSGRAAKCGP